MGKYDLSADSMIEIALRAMTRMGKEYCSKWTSGYYAPWAIPTEAVYSIAIGKALRTAAPGNVFMEYTMGQIAEWSRHNGRKIKKPTRRMDITVMDRKEDRPIFCIEVKKTYKREGVMEDVERCREIVTKKGTVKNAAVLFLIHGQESAENHISAFENVQAEYGADFMVLGKSKVFAKSAEDVGWQRYKYEYEEGYSPRKWAAAAVHIKA